MTSKEFRGLLDQHGLNQSEFARLAKMDARLVRRWCDVRRAHPLTMGAQMRIYVALQLKGMSSKVSP
jgi:DNA-binding transcriptional regulator YiaG